MRIPGTSFRTTWRTDWLSEFSAALILLGSLFREELFTIVGAAVLLILAGLGFSFHRRLKILRKTLHVEQRLMNSRASLIRSIEGELRISNDSKFPALIASVEGTFDKALRLVLRPSFAHELLPQATLGSKFAIRPVARGRFRIFGWTLRLLDPRRLFVGEVTSSEESLIEVYPVIESKGPLTPLALYGESAGIFRKSHSGADYAGTREYAPGDEYGKVEWKATARLGRVMVKEFHPETQTALQILIDAGRTMSERSYVGTRLDEALAVARLLTDSTVGSETNVGIWVYNETEIVKAMPSASAEEQLLNLRTLALTIRSEEAVERHVTPIGPTRATWWRTRRVPGLEGLAAFMRLLGLGYRRTGLYKALAEAMGTNPKSPVILLTDLQTNNDSLAEAAAMELERGPTLVAQIGASWRFSEDLEEAYVMYQTNSRIMTSLERSGLTAFDLRPEILVEVVSRELDKTQLNPRIILTDGYPFHKSQEFYPRCGGKHGS